MIFDKKLESGRLYQLPISDIKLSPLPELHESVFRYYSDDEYVLAAVSPRGSYSSTYLNTARITVVQNNADLSEFFVIDGFEVLDVLDQHPQKNLRNQSIWSLVVEKPNSKALDTFVEAELMGSILKNNAFRSSGEKVHDLLKGITAAANDNALEEVFSSQTVSPQPLPELHHTLGSCGLDNPTGGANGSSGGMKCASAKFVHSNRDSESAANEIVWDAGVVDTAFEEARSMETGQTQSRCSGQSQQDLFGSLGDAT